MFGSYAPRSGALPWLAVVGAAIIQPQPIASAAAQVADVREPPEQCRRELLSWGFDPEPGCRKSLGIDRLSDAQRQAWLQGVLARADRWTTTCDAAYPGWARAAGLPPDARFQKVDAIRHCRAAFATTPFEASDAARAASLRRTLAAEAARSRSAPMAPLAPKLVRGPGDLTAYYPPAAAKAGIEGRALARCKLDPGGHAHGCVIASSSGSPDLDAATLTVIDTLRWEALPGRAGAAEREINVPMSWHLPTAIAPTMSAVAPRLVRGVSDLARYYPKAAWKAGIEGRTVARCALDPTGKARDCSISASSGSEALDAATLRVINDMLWEPGPAGSRRDVRIPVRWTLP